MKMDGTCPLCRAKTPTSDEESVKQLHPWVKKKKAWAQELMGHYYKDGLGVKQSYEMARMLFELAAQQGDASAMYDLGVMYDHGQGVEQSGDKAREWYEQAAVLGDAAAMYNLGHMYDRGNGVEQSYEKAKEYYVRAVREGDASAMNNLGWLYHNGYGVQQSYAKAKEYYERASEANAEDEELDETVVVSDLAFLLDQNNGTEPSHAKVREWYFKAIVDNDAESQYLMGIAYENGIGVLKSNTKARDWHIKAEAQGNDKAKERLKLLKEIEKDMTSATTSSANPNGIVCSFCGLPETATRNFDKLKCPCKSTQYCNTTCQRKHWLDHKKNCQHLIAERKRKKKLKKEQRERNANATCVSDNSKNETTVPKEASDPMLMLKKQEGNDDGGAGKEKTKMTKENEEETEECPICLENLPKDASKFISFTCCGNGMHKHCGQDLRSMKMDGTCPLCRAKRPTSNEESVKQLRPWVKKKKAWAQTLMGHMYRYGKGVKQSYEMARLLFEQAAQQGVSDAMFNLGAMYYNGRGVEQSCERAKEYFEQAAHLGDADAQYELGRMYANSEGVEIDLKKAKDWWTKAAAQGHESSIEGLKILLKHWSH
jgi:TPR repeat protein